MDGLLELNLLLNARCLFEGILLAKIKDLGIHFALLLAKTLLVVGGGPIF